VKPRERILTAINHEEPDRVPICPRITARFLPWLYGDASWESQLKAALDFNFDAYVMVGLPGIDDIMLGLYVPKKIPTCYKGIKQEISEIQIDDYIQLTRIIKTPEGELRERRLIPTRKALTRILEKHKDVCPPNWLPEGYPYIKEYFVRSEEDIEKAKYLLPDPSCIDLKEIERAKRKIGDYGVIVASPTCPFTWIVHLIGVTRCMFFYYRNKNLLLRLLKILNEQALAEIEKLSESDVDIIYFSGCYSSLSVGWGIKIWREIFKPLIKEQARVTHKHGMYYHYYDDGECREILNDLKECNVDIVSTLVPPPFGDINIDEVKKAVGDTICLKGNVSIETLRYGLVKEVIEETRRVISLAANGGGLLLSTTDSVHAYTPLENFRAFIRVGKEYGKYPLKFSK